MADVNEILDSILSKVLGDKAEAEAYSANPTDYLIAEGLGDEALSQIDMGPVVAHVSNELNIDQSVA